VTDGHDLHAAIVLDGFDLGAQRVDMTDDRARRLAPAALDARPDRAAPRDLIRHAQRVELLAAHPCDRIGIA